MKVYLVNLKLTMWKLLPFKKSKKVTKKPKIRVGNKEKCVDNKRKEKTKIWEND